MCFKTANNSCKNCICVSKLHNIIQTKATPVVQTIICCKSNICVTKLITFHCRNYLYFKIDIKSLKEIHMCFKTANNSLQKHYICATKMVKQQFYTNAIKCLWTTSCLGLFSCTQAAVNSQLHLFYNWVS